MPRRNVSLETRTTRKISREILNKLPSPVLLKTKNQKNKTKT